MASTSAATASRAAAAQTLAGLGYPIEWSLRALEACNDDLQAAAEYMIEYGATLQRELNEDERTRESRQKMETAAEEDRWMTRVAMKLGLVDDGNQTNLGGPRRAGETMVWAAADGSEPLAKGKEWGFLLTVSPVFSRETAQKLARSPETQAKLKTILGMAAQPGRVHDVRIVSLVNSLCAKRGTDPLQLSPAELFRSHRSEKKQERLDEETDEEEESELERDDEEARATVGPFDATTLRLRFLILRNFNRRFARSLPAMDFSRSDSVLAQRARNLRYLVFTQVKRTLLERVLAESHVGDNNKMQREKSPTVVLDRTTRDVFFQLFSQLHHSVPASKLRNSDRAFFCILAGESSDDYGGPYRDALNQACQDLMSNDKLMCPVPGGARLPHPRADSKTATEMFEFLGKLVGIAIRTKTPIPIELPSIVWKRLCGERIDVSDVRRVDPDLVAKLDGLERLTAEEWERAELDLRFAVSGIDGFVVDLVPSGRMRRVEYQSRGLYLRLALEAKMREAELQCAAILRGVATQAPVHLLKIFTWSELESMVCGPARVDIDVLRASTVYGDSEDAHASVVSYFWRVLEELDEEDRRRYLRFVWGRTRLPLSAAEWDRKHKINVVDLGRESDEDSDEEEEEEASLLAGKKEKGPDRYLPVGHTCFFSVDLPKYTSYEVCKRKIKYAITHCLTIDADETTNARLNAAFDASGVVSTSAEQDLDLEL